MGRVGELEINRKKEDKELAVSEKIGRDFWTYR